MTRVLLGLALAVAALAVGTACGGSDGPRESGTENGLTRYEVDSAGFSLAVPESWVTVEPSDLDTEAADDFIRDNPAFAPYADMFGPDSPVEFFAADPEPAENGFTTNANVVVLPAPEGLTLEELADGGLGELEAIGGEAIEDDRVTLPAGEAYVFSYRLPLNEGGRRTTVAGRQYGLIAGGQVFSVTYTTLPELVERYDETFTRSAESFRTG